METEFKVLDIQEGKKKIAIAVQFQNGAIGYVTVERQTKRDALFPATIKPHRNYCPNDARLMRILEKCPVLDANAVAIRQWFDKHYPGCLPSNDL